MTESERVWARLKATAEKLAACEDCPSPSYALAIVDQIIRDERAGTTPLEAREYFAVELRRMIASHLPAA